MRRGVAEIGDLFFTQPAHLACGTAEVEIATREFLAFGDEAACAEQHVIVQHGAVEDHRADADQAAIANGAAVQHHAVTNGDLVADLHGCTIGNRCLIGIGAVILDGAVLHDHVLLGAGSLVTEGKELAGGYLYLGSPARQVRRVSEEEIAYFGYAAAHYVKLKEEYKIGG